jgi:hypothetical protein
MNLVTSWLSFLLDEAILQKIHHHQTPISSIPHIRWPTQISIRGAVRCTHYLPIQTYTSFKLGDDIAIRCARISDQYYDYVCMKTEKLLGRFVMIDVNPFI